jgi:catechol 2,3-dioxygenase-like lactoylglutathione lyase family enzyme
MMLVAPVLAQIPVDTEVKSLLPAGPMVLRPLPVFQSGHTLAPMARATIFVRDIETSLKLYRDILGLKPMFDNYWKGQGINKIMGTEGKELRATVLMAGDSVVGNIGIYQLYKERGRRPRTPVQTADTRIGDVAVVFPTNDIWGLTKTIQTAGYVIVSPPVTLLERPNMKQQALEMMFRDADGVLVNLLQSGTPNDL